MSPTNERAHSDEEWKEIREGWTAPNRPLRLTSQLALESKSAHVPAYFSVAGYKLRTVYNGTGYTTSSNGVQSACYAGTFL